MEVGGIVLTQLLIVGKGAFDRKIGYVERFLD